MQLLATKDPPSCQQGQIMHSLWEFAISCFLCYGHMWLRVTKHKGFRVTDLNFQEVSGVWSGRVTPLPHPFNHFNQKWAWVMGWKRLLGTSEPGFHYSFLGLGLLLVYKSWRARIICLWFKRHRMFFREFGAPKTHIYKQTDIAVRQS